MAHAVKLRFNALKVLAFLALTAAAGACVFQRPEIRQLNVEKPPAEVSSPVKAHLIDGSTIVFPDGIRLAGNAVTGYGQRYRLGDSTVMAPQLTPLDSIVGMESYGAKYNVAASVVASSAAVAAGALASVVALVAIFGSCPTVYADSAGTQLLQAESFSYSIAPLFEQRDVDRLRLTPTADGRVILEVRNEALETHYINHLELIETVHRTGELSVPDQSGRPVTVTTVSPPARIHDRSGRDIGRTVAAADGDLFSTSDEILRNVSESDLTDYIELSVPADGDSVALILDMRNSLLNTVLLYDHILAAPGIRSLDWMGKDLENISSAIELGRWYSEHMGMRISVRDGGGYRQVARIGDSGPIAYHQLAVMIPAIRNPDGMVHVRLSFVADDWRIDAIRTSASWRRPGTRRVAASRVAMFDASQNGPALQSLRNADEGYLITTPGQSFSVEFDVGKATEARTYMLASQGYYTEWVRGSWIKSSSGKPFVPGNRVLVEAIRGWRAKQTEMERHFYSTRIATR